MGGFYTQTNQKGRLVTRSAIHPCVKVNEESTAETTILIPGYLVGLRHSQSIEKRGDGTKWYIFSQLHAYE